MSEESKPTLGEIAAREFVKVVTPETAHLFSYDAMPDLNRSGWEAAAGTVAAEVVNPTAEDYDHAAEILRLRALLDQATSLLWDTGMTGNRQAAGELRASGGLEALT